MKKLVKTGLLSVALLATVVVNASERFNIKVAALKSVNVSLTEVINGEQISILDINGVRLFSETINAVQTYSKTFDLSNLPDGVYFLEDNAINTIKVTPVIVTQEKVSFIEGVTKTYIAPRVTYAEGVATVSVDNVSNAPVVVKIYTEDGIEISTTVGNTNSVIYKRYDFSELPAGTYNIVVSEGEYVFTENIEL